MRNLFSSRLIIVVLFTGLFLSGCKGFTEVDVGDIQNFRLLGVENNIVKIQLDVPVTNPNHYNFHLVGANVDIMLNGSRFGTVDHIDKILIPADSEQIYTIKLDVKISNMLGGVFTVMNLLGSKNIDIALEGTIKARYFLFPRTIVVNERSRVNLRD